MQMERVESDLVTMVSIVPACANLSALQLGKWIHSYIIGSGFDLDVMVRTALIDMYAKCGSVDSAQQLFAKMSQRNVVSWNAMIAGYAQNGHANEALALFNEMQLQNLKPDSITMVSTLPACAFLSALQQGKRMHGYIIRSNFESDIVVCNSLIDMYAKCGTLEFARQLFDNMSERTMISWNTMIGGHGMHGHGEDTC
jgi:pentatricopeptide repeat protein